MQQLTNHLCTMARYNEWMNSKIYEVAQNLSPEEQSKNRGAFFCSIIGTLNHLAVADTIWLKRIAVLLQTHEELTFIREQKLPSSLDEILFSELDELCDYRKKLDNTLLKLTESVTTFELDQILIYTNMKGITSNKNLFSIFMHVFNHQTHHRGQLTTLLSQMGIDIGITDLLALIPNETVSN